MQKQTAETYILAHLQTQVATLNQSKTIYFFGPNVFFNNIINMLIRPSLRFTINNSINMNNQ